jgi:CubicO group peptidase (beta-lactamase class C family)
MPDMKFHQHVLIMPVVIAVLLSAGEPRTHGHSFFTEPLSSPRASSQSFSAEGDAAAIAADSGNPGPGDLRRPNNPESRSAEITPIAAASTPPTREDLRRRAAEIPGVSGVLLFQSGQVVFEQYWRSHRRDRSQNIKSASKSVLSALVGRALAEGHIKSLDDPIANYLPRGFAAIPEDRRTAVMSAGQTASKHDITVRHLLTMSSGLASTSFGSYGRWVLSPNWVQFVLNSPLEAAPGTRMRYSTGDTHLLAAVLASATGTSVRAYADRALMRPLGARIGGWDTDPQGIHFGGNNMALSPAALLAFGRLYLDGGRWNGEQLLDPDWVRDSLTPHFLQTSFNPRGHNYGYLWWNNTFGGQNAWFAWGYGGQYVFLLPDLDAVVVITGNPDARNRGANDVIYRTMDEVIVPYLTNMD